MAEREVRLQLGTRAVSVPAGHGREVLEYAGVTVVRVEDGAPVEQAWVPVGTAPSYADDEALIATWHAALKWSQSPERPRPCCGHQADHARDQPHLVHGPDVGLDEPW